MSNRIAIFLFFVLGLYGKGWGQTLLDTYSDGNFTASPVWAGDDTYWTIVTSSDVSTGATNSYTLRLNGPAVAQSDYLSTQIASWGTSQEWGFFVGRRAQAFTAANNSEIWLYANEATIESATVDGYALLIGDDTGGDEIRLARMTNGASVATVITSAAIANTLIDIGLLVRVTRDNSGNWELFTSTLPIANSSGAIASDIPNSTNANVSQGTGTDNTYPPAANGYLGIIATHTTGASAYVGQEFDQIYFTPSSGNSTSSDIIRHTTFTEPTNIAYASYQEVDLTSASLEVAKFTIRDGGASADADALSTTLTAITFSVSNVANLRRIALYDGTTEISEIAAASPASFSSLTLSAADNASKDFSIRVSFLATVTDNQQFQFTVTSATADGAGSTFAAADAGAAASSTTGDANRIEVTATQLGYVQQPSTTNINVAMSPAVTVEAKDANNNRDLDFSSSIRITSTGTLSVTPVDVAASTGLATFGTLVHTATATGRTLNAERTATLDWDVTSNTFDITVPTASSNSVIQAVAASEPATISSIENTAIITTSTEGVQVWQFKLYDGDGSANDADALPTIYTSYTITQGASNTVTDWSAAILALEFFEDANTTPIAGNLTLNSTGIAFTPTSAISVSDGAASNKTISMRLSLKNPLPASSDNKIFHFEIINTNVTTESSATSSQLDVFTVNSDGTKNKIDVIKTKLSFSSVPNIVGLSTNFTVIAAAADANGNTDANATDNVTLAKATGTGTLSSASGLINKPLSSGTYTWSDVQYNTEETFTIQATATGLTTVVSGNILCVNDDAYTTTIVEWNFPPNPKDQYADAGIALNYNPGIPFYQSITSTETINYTFDGQLSKCAYATGWDNGNGTKYWQVEFNTTGYNALKLTSYQRSSGTGPKDFKIQYKIGAGSWTDVTSGTVTVADNWTSGVKTNLALDPACDNKASVLIRWIMTSNIAVGGGSVASGGSSRIDNIIIIGTSGNTITTGTINGSPFCVTTSAGVSVSVPFTSTGTFNSGNIYTAQLSDANGNFAVSTDIGTLTSTANSGTVSATIPASTVDGSSYRIRVVSSDPGRIGSDNGVNLRVYLNIPDASNFNALTASGQVTLNWTNPTGCYDDALIVAKATSNVDPGTPSGDGSAYTANLSYSSGSALLGGYVVYKGNTTGQTVIGLTNGTTYFFKIFLRKGTVWSNGVEISAVPSATLSGEFRSANALTTWTTIAHWETYNGSSWVAAGSYPNDATQNVTIKSGTTVTLNNSPMKVKDLIVENGGKLYTNLVPNGSNNNYINIYGSNVICNGIIGNGTTLDAICFNIEGSNVTISGNGTFDCNRMRKNYNSSDAPPAADITNLIIAININLRWNAVSGTQIYNNRISYFNITVNSGTNLNLLVSGAGNSGNACIDGTNGANASNMGGTWAINGTMNIEGILYATTDNVTARPSKWIIGNGGVINCNQVNCDASGAIGHTIQILDGGKLNMNTNTGFTNFSMTNNTYDFQDGSTVEYSSSISGTQVIQPTQTGFEYSNLLISTDGATKQVIASSTLKVKKNLTITGGVLDPNGSTIQVGGNWSNFGTAGFTEGTSTIVFNGTSSQGIYCPGGDNFNILSFENAGVKTIYDNITAASNLTINTGSGALVANGYDITVGGNWSNYGTAGFTEGTVGTVTFNGSAAQSLSCTGGENFYNLAINNSSTGVTLNNNTDVAGTLTLTSGNFNTGANEMIVSNNATSAVTGHQTDISLAAYTSSSRVNGNMRRTVAATGTYDFPVGTSAQYELANINLTASSGISNIIAFFNPNTGTTPSGIYVYGTEINTLLDYGFWSISPDAVTSVTYDVTATSTGHTNGGPDATYHTLIKRANSGSAWVAYESNHNNSTQSGTGTNPITAKLTGLTGFSHFGIGRGNNPLPVTLLFFDAKYNSGTKAVDIKWVTATEINNDYFTVERSSSPDIPVGKEGLQFTPIGKVQGSGNSSTTLYYEFIDNSPSLWEGRDGLFYYRLKQTDFDGRYAYSDIVPVKIEFPSSFSLQSNPANNSLNIAFPAYVRNKIDIKIFTITGQQVIHQQYTAVKGFNTFPVNVSSLSPGIYMLQLSSDVNVHHEKFVKE